MARELRVSAIIPLPDGVFEEADILAAARPIVSKLEADVATLKGAVEFEVVTPKPRAAKVDEAVLPLRAAQQAAA